MKKINYTLSLMLTSVMLNLLCLQASKASGTDTSSGFGASSSNNPASNVIPSVNQLAQFGNAPQGFSAQTPSAQPVANNTVSHTPSIINTFQLQNTGSPTPTPQMSSSTSASSAQTSVASLNTKDSTQETPDTNSPDKSQILEALLQLESEEPKSIFGQKVDTPSGDDQPNLPLFFPAQRITMESNAIGNAPAVSILNQDHSSLISANSNIRTNTLPVYGSTQHSSFVQILDNQETQLAKKIEAGQLPIFGKKGADNNIDSHKTVLALVDGQTKNIPAVIALPMPPTTVSATPILAQTPVVGNLDAIPDKPATDSNANTVTPPADGEEEIKPDVAVPAATNTTDVSAATVATPAATPATPPATPPATGIAASIQNIANIASAVNSILGPSKPPASTPATPPAAAPVATPAVISDSTPVAVGPTTNTSITQDAINIQNTNQIPTMSDDQKRFVKATITDEVAKQVPIAVKAEIDKYKLKDQVPGIGSAIAPTAVTASSAKPESAEQPQIIDEEDEDQTELPVINVTKR